MSSVSSNAGARKEEWSQAADKAKAAATSAGEAATHATAAVGESANQALRDAGRKADDLTARAGAGMQQMGDRIGRQGPQQGALGTATRSVAESVREGGEYLEDAKLSGMADDVAQLVRRNPLPAVLIAVGLGWCIGRSL